MEVLWRKSMCCISQGLAVLGPQRGNGSEELSFENSLRVD